MAVCPVGAVSILGRRPENSPTLSTSSFPEFEKMSLLIRGRRTVRHYKDENVEPALITKMLGSVSNAPSGVNARHMTFGVIDDKEVMKSIRDKVHQALEQAVREDRIPEGTRYLKHAVPMFRDSGKDLIFRGAPHALIVSTPLMKPCPAEDVVICLSYFELLAQTAGLGTVWWGMLKMVLELIPELKPLLGIRKGYAYYAMLFGVPAVKYPRTVQRDDAAKVKRIVIKD
jgi:nitroreductase